MLNMGDALLVPFEPRKSLALVVRNVRKLFHIDSEGVKIIIGVALIIDSSSIERFAD